MLKINIITIGKNKEVWVDKAVDHYHKYLKKYATLAMTYLPDIKDAKNLSQQELMLAEADLLERKVKSKFRIALSDRGRKYRSEEFAEWLSGLTMNSGGSCDFIIGGIYGLHERILKSSREIISLSPMTMSHQLVRVVLLEQLFRGFSIISGDKYHK
jgi:23S rRNA (pseudouridine1915-N3)-methyltransferase